MKFSKLELRFFSKIGSIRTPKKAAASMRNGLKGGRPRVIKKCGLSARECWKNRHHHRASNLT